MSQPNLRNTVRELGSAIKSAHRNTYTFYSQSEYTNTNSNFQAEVLVAIQTYISNLPDYLKSDEVIDIGFEPSETNCNVLINDSAINIQVSFKYYSKADIPLDNSVLMELQCTFLLDSTGKLEVNISDLPVQPENGEYMTLNPQQGGFYSYNGDYDQTSVTLDIIPSSSPSNIGVAFGHNIGGAGGSRPKTGEWLNTASTVNTLSGYGADGALFLLNAQEGSRRAVVAAGEIAQIGKVNFFVNSNKYLNKLSAVGKGVGYSFFAVSVVISATQFGLNPTVGQGVKSTADIIAAYGVMTPAAPISLIYYAVDLGFSGNGKSGWENVIDANVEVIMRREELLRTKYNNNPYARAFFEPTNWY